MLPADLRCAERQLLAAIEAALGADRRGRWTAELRFEGLRLLPVALRLGERLEGSDADLRLLFPDAGAAALARRDAPALAPRIGSFAEHRRRQGQEADADAGGLLLLVAPSQAEYEEVEVLCGEHRGAVMLLNPTLEDAAVGIGSVARARRRGFLSGWQAAYALIPAAESALRRSWPDPWELYRLDRDGYRLVMAFDHKPDAEEREQALAAGANPGIGAGLRAIDRFIEDLSQ